MNKEIECNKEKYEGVMDESDGLTDAFVVFFPKNKKA